MLKEEQNVGRRVIMGNEDFCAVLPFFTECPYTMCMHQSPVNGPDTSDYYHFHIEFFPPMCSRDKQKFNASSETGVWAHCNPTAPEEKAEELRAAYQRFLEKQQER